MKLRGKKTDNAQSQSRRSELAAQLSAPVRAFMSTEAGSAGLLLVAVTVALIWANSPWSDAYTSLWHTEASVTLGDARLSMDLSHWVNDGLMALFFFVIGLEVRHEVSVGSLNDRRRIVIPGLAGIGGMLVPVLLYLAIAPGGDAARAWGVVIGTDTAFMLGALAVVGPRFVTQLRVFLLAITVIDDIVAVTVIGVVYSGSINVPELIAALLLGVVLSALTRFDVWRAAPYVLIVLVMWLATLNAGLHASIAGMLGGLLIPARKPSREGVEQAARLFRAFRQSPRADVGKTARKGLQKAVSVNERLQTVLHPWSSYVIVPVFALANAGVDLRDGVLTNALGSSLTWAVVVGLVAGKTIGIWGGAAFGTRFGLGRLPTGVAPGHVLGGGALSGLGFTVSLLIVQLAFDDPGVRAEATVGVLLAAVFATVLGWIVFHLAAVLKGQTDADLPRYLDRPVDPEKDHILGPPEAPLTLVEYGDFECPFCARATGVTKELRERFGDRFRYVFRHLPLPDVHPHSELAARAAVAADAQGRFWRMHDLLYQHQDELEYEDTAGYAAELGLDVEKFLRDLDAEETAERVRADAASAEASGVRGAPTFFIGNRRHTGPYDAETLARELEASVDAPSGATRAPSD
ncbi:Na+/H+ antiporter NhaA [Streptomyces pilosus]|uniref:Na(+)/H(+) antiporter NhaA n=1 Tax=Streptomyces pilosus TaxID=28893 RepID=A0A918BQD2_9ACTN|nr:Na+/H+ antiporter NhaA [Streptomyces pilosus]GGQ83472.1 Na(+)/H(+) antiporter NhaA 2 [Streptomyces pilosus]GGV51074.1 Na(+)/H(+) antiporter NhaA 2 [Streptomyces pilosus]